MTPPRDRECRTCGTPFRGREKDCYRCRCKDRECTLCGASFRGMKRLCAPCRERERECVGCGKSFRGAAQFCPACKRAERECVTCGRTFSGTTRECQTCRSRDRECVRCGRSFRGYHSLCRSCIGGARPCESCGQEFRGDMKLCATCRYLPRQCTACGREFKSAFYLDCGTCSGRTAVTNARRRAALSGQQPLPRAVYLRVMRSGPCAYCGSAAESVDHVIPLSRGGAEAEENLVPACQHCNKSKGAKLLSEWRPGGVTRLRRPSCAAQLRPHSRWT